MGKDEIMLLVQNIIVEEESEDPNWSEIEIRCELAIRDINKEDISIDQVVYNFLDEVNTRRRDPKYGHWRRDQMRSFLSKHNP